MLEIVATNVVATQVPECRPLVSKVFSHTISKDKSDFTHFVVPCTRWYYFNYII